MSNGSNNMEDVAQRAKAVLAGIVEQIPEATTGLVQTRSSFQTAVQVIRPRNLQTVERKCLEEAAIAGDTFYYSWKQGAEIVEGLTIGAALAMIRNFGNCAVEANVTEQPFSYIFSGVFIDLETGFNLVRPFRQNKQSPKKKDGSDVYKGQRGEDILFQIGTSKCIRNVSLNAVPKWLADKVFETAKDNVRGKFEKMGPEKAKLLIFKKAEALGIDGARIEKQYGKEKGWDTEKIIQISSALRAVEDGMEKAEELFPFAVDAADQEKSKPDSKKAADPNDAIIAKSQKLKTTSLRQIASAKDVKALDQYAVAFKNSLDAAELTQPDFDELMTELNEKRKVLES